MNVRAAATPARDASTGEDVRYLSGLLDHACIGVVAVGGDGAIVSCNERAAEILERSERELLSAPLARLFANGERERVAALVRGAASSRDRGRAEVFERPGAHGRRQFLELTGVPLDGSNNGRGAALVLVQDVTERTRAERQLAAQYGVTRVLAEAETLADAAPRILEAVGESLGWEAGTFWRLDERANALRCLAVWASPSAPDIGEFAALTGKSTFPAGEGLPGRVWASGKPMCIRGIVDDPNFPRAGVATRAGLHAGFGFPITLAGTTLGVIDFFSREVEPDEELLRMTAAVGSQIAQFVERKETEKAQAFIAEVSSALGSSLEYEDTLATVAGLAVPALADLCVIDVIDDDGTITRVASTARDPRKQEVLRELQERYPPEWADHEASRGLLAGEPLVFAELSESVLETFARDEGHLDLIRRLDAKSAIAAPLVARDKTIGALTLVASESGRRYGPNDLALAEEVARRAAIAIDRSRLYEAERRARAEAEQASKRLRDVHAITETALTRLGLDDLLDELLGRIAAILSVDIAAVLLADEGGGTLTVRAVQGLEEEAAAAIRIRVGEGVAGRVAAEQRPVVVEDVDPAKLASPVVREWGIRSLLGVPLLLGERVTGVVLVATLAKHSFADDEIALLQFVADRVALSIEQGRLYEAEHRARAEAEDATKRLQDLQAVTEAALAHLTLDDLLDDLLHRVAEILGVDTAAILLEEDEMLVARAAKGLEEEVERGFRIAVGKGFAGRVAAERRPVVIEDVKPGDALSPLLYEKGVRSLLGVPLVIEGDVIGVLHVGTLTPRRFTATDARVLQLVADRVALAIENAELYHEAQERAHAALVLAYVADGVFLLDRDGVVRLWNPAAEAITGLPAEEVVGRPAAEAIPGWETLARLVTVGPPGAPARKRAEMVPLEIGDRELWLSISGVAFEEGTVYAFRDLSEERALEELRNELVATVSHELRTPLAAVYGAAVTLRRKDVDLDEDQRNRLLGIVANESDRLARILEEILWASRLDSGSVHVSIERCDAAAIASDVIEAAKAHVPRRVALELHAPPSLPAVACDPDKVRRVLSNLIDNAVKYSPDGGVVRVAIDPCDRRLRFSVCDEGLGIPRREQERIFEKFYRLDPNLTRGIGGTGLGLYISRELVRRMNGRIWVASKEGEGSTFVVELPLANGSA